MKKVILYGAGLAGEKFYWAYRKKYEIEYVLDRCCNRMFHNIPVYSFEEKKKDLYGHFVIAATDKENIYYEISGILRSIGMIELRDFISVQMVEKKLVVMYGNCHMIILEKYLQKQPEFQRRYVIKRYYIAEMDEKERYYSKEQIVRNFKEQLGKLKQREVECSIKISDFIETNYKIQQLFFDPNHPCNVLICEKGKRILKLLNLKVKEDVIVDDALDEGELFIYG